MLSISTQTAPFAKASATHTFAFIAFFVFGICIAVFIAFLSSLTRTGYTATQYALFSSLMTLPGQFAGGFSGWLVDIIGYAGMFLTSAALGIPAILLALWYWRVTLTAKATDEGAL